LKVAPLGSWTPFGGLEYLRSRKDVDGSKVVLVGWGSNGGLEGMSAGFSLPKELGVGFAGAVLYYPECAKAGTPFSPYAPIQVFVGGKDSWNPASACRSAAARQKPGSSPFNIKVYPEAYPSFDGPGNTRMNAFSPKLGIVGRNSRAALDSYVQAEAFLTDLLALTAMKGAD
jgi:dienelactone hydrolase